MSLFTNPRAILISDGESSYESDHTGHGVADYVYGRPRRYGDDYYSRGRHRSNSRSDSSSQDSSDASSVDVLVRHTLRRRYTDLERDLGAAAGLSGTPFRNPEGRRSRARQSERRGLRQGILVDDASSSGAVDSDEAAERDAAYLQRLHRGLMQMRMEDRPEFGDAHRKPKKKVTMDKATFDRLTKPNASMAAKQQEKYEKRVEREQNEKAKRVRPSAVSVKAGQRLHLQAKDQQKELERRRQERAEEEAKKADKEWTFQPTITAMAERLAADEGYRTIEERVEDYKLKQEEVERRRIDLQVEEMHKHPFHPTVCRGTQQIVDEQRARSRSRGRSRGNRSRSRSRSGSRGRRGCEDPGQRLYRDGGERLLRQQIRRRLAEQAAGKSVIGNGVRLTKGKQEQVSNRLEAWQQTREKNVAALREEAERMRTEKRNLRAGARAPPPPSVAAGDTRRRVGSPDTGALPLKTKRGRKNVEEKAEAPRTPASARADGASRPPSTTPSSSLSLSQAPVDPFAHFTPQQKAMYDELRRIRFGALFYKYTAGSPVGDDGLSLEQVSHLVHLMYPEDAGVVKALSSAAGANSQVTFSKEGFIRVLLRYEQRHGPQPWARSEKDALLFPMPLGSNQPAPPPPAKFGRSASLPEARHSVSGQGKAPATPRPTTDGKPHEAAVSSKQTQTPNTSRYRRAASATSLASGETAAGAAGTGCAQRVSGTRTRSASVHRGKPLAAATQSSGSARARSSSARRPLPPECTFSPRVSKHTERLSRIDLERRAGYSQEMELRKRELELLRTLNSGEAPSHRANRQTTPTTLTTTATTGATPPKSFEGRGRSSSGSTAAAGEDGLSPSMEVSSLSGGSADHAALAKAPPPSVSAAAPLLAKPRTPLQGAAASKAMRELEALLDGGAGSQPPQGVRRRTSPAPPQVPQPAKASGEQEAARGSEEPKRTAAALGASGKAPQSSTPAGLPPTRKAPAEVLGGTPGRTPAQEGGKANGFSEETMSDLFDAMYRKDRRSVWM